MSSSDDDFVENSDEYKLDIIKVELDDIPNVNWNGKNNTSVIITGMVFSLCFHLIASYCSTFLQLVTLHINFLPKTTQEALLFGDSALLTQF